MLSKVSGCFGGAGPRSLHGFDWLFNQPGSRRSSFILTAVPVQNSSAVFARAR